MTNVDIYKDGFKLNGDDHGVINIAPVALKIALKSFFSTYKSIKHTFNVIKNPDLDFSKEEIDRSYFSDYYENYSETITHFHHYIELSLKHILQSKHKLLVDEISDPVILFKFLNGDITLEDLEKGDFKSLSYSETVNSVCALIKEDIIPQELYKFILESRPMLNSIGILRNRLMHRGMYIIRYKALDEIIGKQVLPFVLKMASSFADDIPERIWKYKGIECGIDPLSEIIHSFENEAYNMEKIAFLKELGRAAYNNNLTSGEIFKFLKDIEVKRYENSAKIEEPDVYEIVKCPVCGINTLRVFRYEDGDLNEDGFYDNHWEKIYSVCCIQCGFEINDDIGNPKQYGYNNLPEWFWARDL